MSAASTVSAPVVGGVVDTVGWAYALGVSTRGDLADVVHLLILSASEAHERVASLHRLGVGEVPHARLRVEAVTARDSLADVLVVLRDVYRQVTS